MTFQDFNILTYTISEYGYLLVGVVSLSVTIKYKRFHFLTGYLLVNGVIRFIANILADAYIPNLYLYHLIGLVQFVLIYFHYRKLFRSKKWELFLWIGSGLYVMNSVFWCSIYEFNSLALALVQLSILIFGIRYLYQLYRSVSVQKLNQNAFFIINLGLMIYSSGTFFVNLLSSRIVNQSTIDFFSNGFIIETLVVMIMFIVILFGFGKVRNEQ